MYKPSYIKIDLTHKKVEPYPISEEIFQDYIGGKTLGAKILYDELEKGVDPLSPDNIFIVNTGPLNGTGAPASSRFNITTKNVLTGGIASSNCGGTFGFKLRQAGYDGLIVQGKSENPVFLQVIDGRITFKDATEFWGMDIEKVQHEFEPQYGKLVIGVAGENLVRYACAASGERVAGRCGVGAVMGSKNLKGILAYGTQKIYNENPEKLKKYIQKWVGKLRNHPSTGQALPLYGTAGLLSKCNASGILPTKNFKTGSYEFAEEISGEALFEKHLVKNSGCISCPIRCERRVMINQKEVKGPEYETLGLFGANIENSDLSLINQWNYEADILGLDTISLAGTLSYAMELQEKGVKDFGLVFGKNNNISEIIAKIANREGVYKELGEGSKWLSEIYGGSEYAIHAKGLEIAAYEPRRSVGMGLGYATSNRGGCHLNGGYASLLENLGVIPMDPLTTKGKPELVVLFQNLMEAVSASGFCLQTVQLMIPSGLFKFKSSGKFLGFLGKTMLNSRGVLGKLWNLLPGLLPFNTMHLAPHSQALKLATGIKMTTGEFFQLGERGFNIERLFNVREGLGPNMDRLPERLTQEAIDEKDQRTIVNLSEMLPVYYKVRGWSSQGEPESKKLEKLRIK